MGYYNPVYIFGTERFVKEAVNSGVDGVIIVDLPPEEEAELGDHARAENLNMIRLVTPTTDDDRLGENTARRGRIYLLCVDYRITGAASAKPRRSSPVWPTCGQRPICRLPSVPESGHRTMSPPWDRSPMPSSSDHPSSIRLEDFSHGGKTVADVIRQVGELAAALQPDKQKRARL
jgi:hypothetical protein